MVQSSGTHLPGNAEVSFTDTNWWSAPTSLPPAAWGQVLFFIGLIEGCTSSGLYDLWNGVTDKREPGNLGPFFGSGMLSKDKAAADKMRLKELKNARLAMIAWAGIAANHFIPGALPGCMYNSPDDHRERWRGHKEPGRGFLAWHSQYGKNCSSVV